MYGNFAEFPRNYGSFMKLSLSDITFVCICAVVLPAKQPVRLRWRILLTTRLRITPGYEGFLQTVPFLI